MAAGHVDVRERSRQPKKRHALHIVVAQRAWYRPPHVPIGVRLSPALNGAGLVKHICITFNRFCVDDSRDVEDTLPERIDEGVPEAENSACRVLERGARSPLILHGFPQPVTLTRWCAICVHTVYRQGT